MFRVDGSQVEDCFIATLGIVPAAVKYGLVFLGGDGGPLQEDSWLKQLRLIFQLRRMIWDF